MNTNRLVKNGKLTKSMLYMSRAINHVTKKKLQSKIKKKKKIKSKQKVKQSKKERTRNIMGMKKSNRKS